MVLCAPFYHVDFWQYSWNMKLFPNKDLFLFALSSLGTAVMQVLAIYCFRDPQSTESSHKLLMQWVTLPKRQKLGLKHSCCFHHNSTPVESETERSDRMFRMRCHTKQSLQWWNTVLGINDITSDLVCRPTHSNIAQFNIQHVEHLHLGGTQYACHSHNMHHIDNHYHTQSPPDVRIPSEWLTHTVVAQLQL